MENSNEIDTLNRLKEQGFLTDTEYLNQLERLKKAERVQNNRPKKMTPEEKRQRILFSFVLLAVFCILSGLGLIVASNWLSIPPTIRVIGGFTLLGLSLLNTYVGLLKNKVFWKEIWIFISFFLIAGNMAVIQQAYGLSLTWAQGSLIWWCLSLPLMVITKNKVLHVSSAILLIFGAWEYIRLVIENLNYLLIAGILSVVILLTFLIDGKKAAVIRNAVLGLAFLTLFVGDIYTEAIVGFISTIVFFVSVLALPKTEEGQVRFCHYMFIFMAWRIFLLFCSAYHNLMSLGIQLVVFGTILLLTAGVYYYFFNRIQSVLQKLVHHE